MPRLIWVLSGRTVILLILSWGGPIISQSSVCLKHTFASCSKDSSTNLWKGIILFTGSKTSYITREIFFDCKRYRMSQVDKKDVVCVLSNQFFLSNLSKSVNIIIKQRKCLPSLWNKIRLPRYQFDVVPRAIWQITAFFNSFMFW